MAFPAEDDVPFDEVVGLRIIADNERVVTVLRQPTDMLTTCASRPPPLVHQSNDEAWTAASALAHSRHADN